MIHPDLLGGILRNMKGNICYFDLMSFRCRKRDSEYFFYVPFFIDNYYPAQAKGIYKSSLNEVKIK